MFYEQDNRGEAVRPNHDVYDYEVWAYQSYCFIFQPRINVCRSTAALLGLAGCYFIAIGENSQTQESKDRIVAGSFICLIALCGLVCRFMIDPEEQPTSLAPPFNV